MTRPFAASASLFCLLALAGAAAMPRQGQPALEIESPAEGAYISGVITLRARVTPATLVQRLTFFFDGRQACVLDQPPFECQWDAGPGVEEHQVRAVAQLRDGGRLTRSARTKGVEYIETVDVDAVQVPVTVTDDAGRFVRGIPREAFRLREDGVAQVITSFAGENIPLEIVVAVDVSGSMSRAMPQVKASVAKFLSALRPQDRVTVLAFNDNVFLMARPTADLPSRLKAVDRLASWGGTVFYEAIIGALDLQGTQVGRRALVLFTDGEDRNSRVPMSEAERKVEESDSLVYIIGLGQGAQVAELKRIIEKLARLSGGRAFFADRAERLDQPFAEIVEELSSQYLLGYTPRNGRKDGNWRAIRVDVDRKGVHVRAREGYRAVKPGQKSW